MHRMKTRVAPFVVTAVLAFGLTGARSGARHTARAWNRTGLKGT